MASRKQRERRRLDKIAFMEKIRKHHEVLVEPQSEEKPKTTKTTKTEKKPSTKSKKTSKKEK